jgi:hypothetical protein
VPCGAVQGRLRLAGPGDVDEELEEGDQEDEAEQQNGLPPGDTGALALRLLDAAAAADAAHDPGVDLGVGGIPPRTRGVGRALQSHQNLVVSAGVELHPGELDDVVRVAKAGVGAEELAQVAVAELGHHDAGDPAFGELDADADPVLGTDGVVLVLDGGRAGVLDAQQDERRVVEGPAVLRQLLQRALVVGVDLVGGGGVHLDPVAEPLAADEDELVEERAGRDEETEDGECDVPGQIHQIHDRSPGSSACGCDTCLANIRASGGRPHPAAVAVRQEFTGRSGAGLRR